MKKGSVFAVFGVLFILAACQTTEQETASAQATPADIAALKKKWEGTWSGSWGGSCTGSIKVSDVAADSAYVKYSWGICGNAAPGSYIDRSAKIDGNTLTVHLYGRTKALYSHTDENTLQGNYERPRDGSTATGLFTRES